MKYISKLFIIIALLGPTVGIGQIAGTLIPDTVLLKQHISTLAADAMEGRETGTQAKKWLIST